MRHFRILIDIFFFPFSQQLKSDPFMKQVQHGTDLSAAMQQDPSNADIYERIKVQLSHSDGIRGFMVPYLTATEEGNTEPFAVPDGLATVLQQVARSNPADLVPLACK